jgi:hypothetical protein
MDQRVYTPLHDCYGKQVIEGISGKYVSPEEVKFMRSLSGAHKKDGRAVYACKWPSCPCPTSSVSGVFRRERLEWLMQQARSDPSFSLNDVEFPA